VSDWLDKIIEEAIRKGQFDDLPGKGKPLNLDPNPHEDPERRLAHKVLHDAGYKLPWIDERNEIEAAIKNMQTILARDYDDYRAMQSAPHARSAWDAAVANFYARVVEINKRTVKSQIPISKTPKGQRAISDKVHCSLFILHCSLFIVHCFIIHCFIVH